MRPGGAEEDAELSPASFLPPPLLGSPLLRDGGRRATVLLQALATAVGGWRYPSHQSPARGRSSRILLLRARLAEHERVKPGLSELTLLCEGRATRGQGTGAGGRKRRRKKSQISDFLPRGFHPWPSLR